MINIENHNELKVVIRPATEKDAEILLNWRNDPTTRIQSHSSEYIDKLGHIKWLKNSIDNPDINLFIAEVDGQPVGTSRADLDQDKFYQLSWTVSPNFRGQGLGKNIVKQMVGKFKKCKAQIKKGNLASVKIADYAGLKLCNKSDDVLFFKTD